MGMSPALIGPLFIGNIVLVIFELGHGFSVKMINDVKFGRFIDYHFSLPLSSTWLLVQYITKFVIEAAVITLPILILGIILLSNKFVIVHTNWFAFVIMYLLMLIFLRHFFYTIVLPTAMSGFFPVYGHGGLIPSFYLAAYFLSGKKCTLFLDLLA